MRMRKRPWVDQELEECPFFIKEPQKSKGKWEEQYCKKQAFHIELGCGKGGFLSQMAYQNPHINYLGIDLVDTMLGFAKRNIEKKYEKTAIENVLITRHDIERILLMLDPKDCVERLYINFCNPWPKAKHRKKRLTHPKQLELYKIFLKEDGEIHFKTDDDVLFFDTLVYFEQAGYEILKKTQDLHAEMEWENIQTEHEKMFSDQGIKIKAIIAKRI